MLRKDRPGYPHPDAAAFRIAPAGWQPPAIDNAAVGDLPEVHGIAAPANHALLESMTRSQMADMAYFYNDSFGLPANGIILAADARASFKRFLGLEV
jgi:hypothetical protein